MNLQDVMDELAAAANTIEGVRGFSEPQQKLNPPTFMPTLPTSIIPRATYAKGVSTMRLPCIFAVALLSSRSSVKKLVSFLNLAGPLSLVRALEDFPYTACDIVRVAEIAADKVITVNRVDYLGAEFILDIGGSGGE